MKIENLEKYIEQNKPLKYNEVYYCTLNPYNEKEILKIEIISLNGLHPNLCAEEIYWSNGGSKNLKINFFSNSLEKINNLFNETFYKIISENNKQILALQKENEKLNNLNEIFSNNNNFFIINKNFYFSQPYQWVLKGIFLGIELLDEEFIKLHFKITSKSNINDRIYNELLNGTFKNFIQDCIQEIYSNFNKNSKFIIEPHYSYFENLEVILEKDAINELNKEFNLNYNLKSEKVTDDYLNFINLTSEIKEEKIIKRQM